MNIKRSPFDCLLSLATAVTILLPLAPAHAEDLKVGFIGGLSGPFKVYGEASKNGLEMGLDAAGRKGVKVIYEDDQFTPAKTVTAFKKLTEVDKVDLLIVLASSPSKAVAPLAEQKQIPLLAWASDAEVAHGRKFVIRSWVSGEAEAERLATEVKRRNLQRVGFLISTTDYGRSVRDGFKKSIDPSILVEEAEYPADAQDFKPFLLKLRAKGATALGMCLNPGQSGASAKQAKDLGMKLEIFGCETLDDMHEVKLSEGALLGSWFVTAGVTDKFHEEYLKRFGNDDVLAGAAVHYDIGKLLSYFANAATSAPQFSRYSDHPQQGGVSTAALLNSLRSAKVQDGASGTFEVRVTPDDQYFDIHLILKQVTPSGFTTIAK